MPNVVKESGNSLFSINFSLDLKPDGCISDTFEITVNESSMCFILSLERLSESRSHLYNACLMKRQNVTDRNSLLSTEVNLCSYRPCSVWSIISGNEKCYMSKEPNRDVWMSDPLDMSALENNASDNSLLNFVLWMQFEKNLESFALLQFRRLFQEQKHCDFHFCFKDGKIGSHVAILAARCSVFGAMFQHETKEMRSREVVIKDIQQDIFRELLNFIYCGQISNNLPVASLQLLFEAANKYCINDLKDVCLNFLSMRLELETVIEVLVWAHYNSAWQLKKIALELMSRNSEEVSKLPEWEEMIRYHFDAFNDNSVFQ